MTDKEVAMEIIKTGEDIKQDAVALKNNVESLLLKNLQKIKNVVGEMPDEATFLNVIGELIDAALVLPQPAETVDGVAIKYGLKLLDKYVLDKFLGADWYAKLMAKVK